MGVPVILSWLLMNAPILLGYEYRKQVSLDTTDEDTPSVSNSGILALAKLTNYQQIMALSSELHYLDVITINDHQLVLYSLATAVADMPDDLGMQVHRSHWVAYAAVEQLQKVGRQGILILKTGHEIPVSRANFSRVQRALANHLN